MQRIAWILTLLLVCHVGQGAPLGGVIYHGGTPFSPQTLLLTYADLLGVSLQPADIKKIEQRFLALYEEHGYAQPQVEAMWSLINPAVLELHIWQPRISEVRISGRGYLRTRSNLRKVEALKSLYPLGAETFAQALRGLRQDTNLFITGELLPDQQRSNSYVAKVRVRPRPWELEMGVDNRGLERFGYEVFEGRLRASTGRYGAQVRWRQAADADEYQYQTLRSDARFGRTMLQLSAAQSQSYIETTDYEYERDLFRARWIQTLIDHADRNLRATLAVERYDISRAFGSGLDIDERFSVVNLGLSSAVVSGRQRHTFSAGMRAGLDGLGAGSELGTDLKFRTSRLHYRGKYHFESPYELWWDARAQLSTHVLPAPERFTYGGEALGGAFEPGALSGDSGFSARLTVARKLRRIGPVRGRWFAYSDYGRVWREVDESSFDSSSAGIGIEATTDHLSFVLEYTHVIQDSGAEQDPNRSRVLFAAKSRF